ncbi:MAG TPA: GAF domain-containing protein [Fimbriimonadaceae bacterium]|nr:GAF domain-containing protein [Fimbriimonadaceae bacterium]HRJ32061.1 GAF domain-containing protein [Fimbriimonadaceae bacterium]
MPDDVEQAWASHCLDLVARAQDGDALLQDLVNDALDLSEADGIDLLVLENDESLVLRASTTLPDFVGRLRLGQGIGLAGQASANALPFVVESNLRQHPLFVPYPGYDELDHQASVFLPLLIGGTCLGVAVFRKDSAWTVRPDLMSKLESLSAGMAKVVGALRVTSPPGSRMGALSEVAKVISASPYLEEILQLLVNTTAQQFGFEVCTVRLLDEASQELVLKATQSTDRAYRRKRAIKLTESIAGRAIRKGAAEYVRDVLQETDYIGHDLAVEQNLRSMVCVPLIIQGRPVGVMSCYTNEVRAFSDEEIGALETLAKQAAVSIEHAKLQVRSTLMQEMHHRVKNNLQQVASLLRIQMRQPGDKTVAEVLEDSLGRILAIAAVHELLSREDLDLVGVRTVAESLVQVQQQSLLSPETALEFRVQGDNVRLSVQQATQVALLLNELIANAVQHGFVVARSGQIHVTIEELGDEVGLWVSNLGDPLPPQFDLGQASSLGLTIVESLTKALRGRFLLEDRLGWTVAEIRFPRASSE